MRDNLDLTKLIEEDLLSSIQKKRSKLREQAKEAIEKI